MVKNIFLFICVSFYFTIDTVAQADMIVDGDAVISGNTIIGIPGINSTFSVNGIGVIRQPDLRQFVIPNWSANATTKKVIASYYDGQSIYAPVTRYFGPLGNFGDIGLDTLGSIIFQTADVTKMTILQDGKVGVGMITPLELLDINGGIRLGNTTNTNEGTIRYNGNLEGYVGGEWKSLTGASTWNNAGTSLFYDGGAVQVGSPLSFQKFTVLGSITFKQDGVRSFIIPEWAPDATTKRVVSGYYDGQGVYAPVTRYYGPSFNFADIGVDTLGNFILQTADVTRMTVLQDGKVGIGNTVPMEKLDINGGIRLGNTSSANNGTMRYNGSDIEGHIGGAWTSLTSGGSLWTPSGSDISYTGGKVGIGTPASSQFGVNLLVDGQTNLGALALTDVSGIQAIYGNVAFTIEPTIAGVNTSFLLRRLNGGALQNALSVGAVSGNVVATYDLAVLGNLSKGAGSFKIDHPLDPENKYLYHSFVESPDMMNVYNGNTTTDENGNATVTLPDYFEALNRDFRYQLTAVGTFAQVIIKEKLANNAFVIASSEPNVEVSWQITGIRQDAYANKNRIPNEVDKRVSEKGTYLHPEAFNQPLSKKLKVEHEAVKEEDLPKRDTSKGITIQEEF